MKAKQTRRPMFGVRCSKFEALFTLLLLLLACVASDAATRHDVAMNSASPTPPGGTQRLASPDAVPDGLSAADWSGIRQQVEQQRHCTVPVDGGHQARNPGQQWLTRFDGRGFLTRPEAGGWQWGLELQSYGFAGHERAVTGQPRVSAEGQRVTYDWDATLQEWFVNDRRGLEHGFTVRERPSLPEPRSSRREEAQIKIRNPKSEIRNRWSLLTSAATVKEEVPLTFTLAVRGGLRPEVEADGRGVRFVDAQGAAALTYSGLTVRDADGRTLPARFEPMPRSSGRESAHSSSKRDQRRLTSAATESLRLAIEESGARYPLTIDPIAQQAYLKASNTGPGDWFSESVAVSGDTVVVGAYFEDSAATGVNGNQADNNANSSGAVYVFVRNGTTWTQQAYLKASNTDEGDNFGGSVAISGDTVVVGAAWESSAATGVNGNQSDNNAKGSGAAYVFVRNGTTWSQQAYLKASNTGSLDFFGFKTAISGDTVVVTAYEEDSAATGVNGNQGNNSATNSGAAYVFVRNGTTWTQQAYLKASNTEIEDDFGLSVAVSGDTVVVGALNEDSAATGVNGDQSDNSTPGSGAAYVFVRNGTTWSQQAYLKASNTDASDRFGAVAISGDTVVVGADLEASAATGVNGDQSDNTTHWSGAAYMFVRDGTTWTQQAYLKASNTDASDSFGGQVAISGDTVVVGAAGESSAAKGVNGNQSDNSARGAGAAYVFVRNGTTWSQQAYLKASNTETGDNFGWPSLAVSGNTVVFGAALESSAATGVNGNQANNNAGQSGAVYVFSCPNRVALASDGSGGYFIRHDGFPGHAYRLQRAASLSGPWPAIATNTAPPSGLLEFHDTTPLPGQAFYRVGVP